MGVNLEDFLFGLAPPRWIWRPLIKRWISGDSSPLVLRPARVVFPEHLERLGLYLHVPFCRDPCPYCPYNRVEYDESLYRRYETAAHQEIDLVARRLAASYAAREGWPPQVVSLYVGGGTPTVVPQGLARLIGHITEAFGTPGDICVELHPAAMDDRCLEMLKSVGVTMLSVGVESLSDRLLRLIGRSHDAATARDAVRRALRHGFEAVNVDLMFALPTQTLDDLDHDLGGVLDLGPDQVSAYPIFGFPYTGLGRKLGLKRTSRPPADLVRRMLALISRRSQEHGLQQCAVWSFLRPAKKKFSSITRHHYVGFGPSAASMTGRQFYVNTFSVTEYVRALPDRLPVALVHPMNRRLEMAYWLYWRAYEMNIPADDFRELFGEELEDVYGRLLRLLQRLGTVHKHDGCYRITESGAYYIHRLQNEYSLNYIDRLWGRCRADPWPAEVTL